jgi:hypothetical protein
MTLTFFPTVFSKIKILFFSHKNSYANINYSYGRKGIFYLFIYRSLWRRVWQIVFKLKWKVEWFGLRRFLKKKEKRNIILELMQNFKFEFWIKIILKVWLFDRIMSGIYAKIAQE